MDRTRQLHSSAAAKPRSWLKKELRFVISTALLYTALAMKRQATLRTLGEKLFDLGNLAAAALLFGKALAPEEVPTSALVIGGLAFVSLYLLGCMLVYFGAEES